jgi:hypothetical protein
MAVDRAMKRFIRVCALTVGVVILTQAAEAQTRVGPWRVAAIWWRP